MIQSPSRYLLIAVATSLGALGQSSTSPNTTSPNIILGAGYVVPTPLKVAPGQVVTIFASGVGSVLTQPVYAGPGNLPTSLAGISVTIRQGTDTPAPILEVSPVATCGASCGVITAITIQIPYTLLSFFCPLDIVCPASNVVIATELFVTENGVAGNLATLTPLPDQVHILTVCDSVLPGVSGSSPIGGLPCQPEVTHANGMLVSSANPATVGEEVVAYAVGLGATNPAVPQGQAATQPVPTVESFRLDFNFHADALPAEPLFPTLSSLVTTLAAGLALPPVPLFTGLTPDYPGLYQINFIVPPVPSGALPCAAGSTLPPSGLANSNLTVSMGGSASFDGAAICVALPK